MLVPIPGARPVDPATVNPTDYDRECAAAIIKTKDGLIALQQRGAANNFAHFLSPFGGGLEADETPEQGMIRELREELELQIAPGAAIYLATMIEDPSPGAPRGMLLHIYFYHDAAGAMGACNEWSRAFYETAEGALSHPLLSSDGRWGLEECVRRGLLK